MTTTISTKRNIKEKIINLIQQLPFIISFCTILVVIYDFGYNHNIYEQEILQKLYLYFLSIEIISIIARYFFQKTRPRLKVLPFDFSFLLILIVLISIDFNLFEKQLSFLYFLKNKIWIYIALFLIFTREFSSIQLNFKYKVINPATLFIISFLLIIIAGGFLLMLPNATHTGISIIDAMFTSTSAVCVTGLVVVDTGSFFTEFGQIIILILFQIGGLGIMTFASYFSYFFKGSSSYEHQLLVSDMTNTDKIGEVFNTLKRIIIVTLFIESLGAFLILQSINKTVIPLFSEQIFFSVFHSVSGFCNAGFSTMQNSLYEHVYKFNYPLHLIIAFLIILGGIGFPIVLNLLRYLKRKLTNLLLNIFRKKKRIYLPWIININTRIVLLTSVFLTVFGTIFFFIFEYNNTLSEHSFFGKIITSFFGAVTTRTAGFNSVDTSTLALPTVLIVLFLMWVGASPASTGGGIKTSTLAIAILNFISLAKGKSRIEIYKREIAQSSVNRAFAIIVLSILVIFISIFSISFFDIEKGLLNISFECVSAFSTVGLSRGITADLSTQSKFIIILTMFIGRVSMLTIFIAIFKKVSYFKYRYPTEEVLIN